MKKYAIIYSAYNNYNGNLLTSAYHHLNYEHVCGFSLGKGMVFFDSLDTAKQAAFPSYTTEEQHNDFDRRKRQAIISLECDESENHITGIDKIHTVSEICEEYYKVNIPGQLYAKVHVPVWSERSVQQAELTEGALEEINKEYELRFYKQNPGKFLDYHLMESYLTWDAKERAHTKTAVCEELDKQFEAEHKKERVYTQELPSLMTTAAGASLLFTSGLLSYFLTAADAADPFISNMIKVLAVAGGIFTGAGLTAQIYSAKLDEEKKHYVRHGLFKPENQKRMSEANVAVTKLLKNHGFS